MGSREIKENFSLWVLFVSVFKKLFTIMVLELSHWKNYGAMH
jgi:hypothetical protein